MEKFLVIVLMILGAALTTIYLTKAVTNYGETRQEKIFRFLQHVLGWTGALMFVISILLFPIFVI